MSKTVESNPLLEDFTFPPYDVIQPNHVCPAVRSLLTQLEKDFVELENSVEPTWPKLVMPLEKIVDRLSVVWGIVNHLNSVSDSPDLRAATAQVQPEKVEFQLRLKQSKPIYNAFKTIRDSSEWENLSDSRKRVVELRLKESLLNGISLEDTKRERFNEIEQELEKLGQIFDENLLDATKRFEKLITDKREIEGLPMTTLALAAEMAVSKGYVNATAENGPWIVTLNGPIYYSILQHVRNRKLREEMYRAYVTRASDGSLNNTPIIERILVLRLEKAKLLGFENYAEVTFETKMATFEKARELIEKLRDASWNPAIQDMEDLRSIARDHGAEEAKDINHWDFNFWGERIRESKYDINEEDLRPFFSLPRVLDGLFNLSKKLFDIIIEPADGIAPVWNRDVSFYKVKHSSGTICAYFYLDPYSRPSEKRGGAWVDTFIGRSSVVSTNGTLPRLPICNVVCNLTPPTKDKPSLMTIREVETIFHEFGHALQNMLTTENEGFVSTTKAIERDAVEIPSLFMENWCYQRETLLGIAKHYETGESLPEDTCSRILSVRTFRAGSLLLRQLRYACVDLELHSSYIPGGGESIYDIDHKIGNWTHSIPLVAEDRFLCSFNHIFADTYAACYYGYQWAEVFSSDAFSAFEEAGLDNEQTIRETGHKFRDTILAFGGGKSPNEVFLQFRGRETTADAFLRYNGLLPTVAAAS